MLRLTYRNASNRRAAVLYSFPNTEPIQKVSYSSVLPTPTVSTATPKGGSTLSNGTPRRNRVH